MFFSRRSFEVLMFFRLRERERPRSRKGRRLSDSLILVGDAGKKHLKTKTKVWTLRFKNGPAGSQQVCLTAGASGRGGGTCLVDELGLDLSHLNGLYREVGTVHSDSSSCKTVSQFSNPTNHWNNPCRSSDWACCSSSRVKSLVVSQSATMDPERREDTWLIWAES